MFCYTRPVTRRELLSSLAITLATAPSSQAAYVIASPCAAPGRRYPACLNKYAEAVLRNPAEQLLARLRAKSGHKPRQTRQNAADKPIDEASLREELQQHIFVLALDVDEKAFVDSANLSRDLGLDMVSVVRVLEGAFSIKISDDAARRFTTIGDVVNYLKPRVKERDVLIDAPTELRSILPCVDSCPVNAIHPTEQESGFGKTNMAYIDPVECIDCGECIKVCPVRAIFTLEDLPAKWSHYSETNAKFFNR